MSRYLWYYSAIELLSIVFAYWLFSGHEWIIIGNSDIFLSLFSTNWPHTLRACFIFIIAYIALFFFGFFVQLVRRLGRHQHLKWTPTYSQPKWTSVRAVTADGVELNVRISEPVKRAKGLPRKKVVLLAQPLGHCGPSYYAPVLAEFGPHFVYITWDYRGFFGSPLGESRRLRPQSIQEHARDAMTALQACGFTSVDIIIGHSMGTVVGLEMSVLFPDKVGALVLLNGFHGHVFQTAFQPLIRIPFINDLVCKFFEILLANRWCLYIVRKTMLPIFQWVVPLYARLLGSPLLRESLGETYFLDFLDNYMGQLCASPENLHSYLRMFQELDAYSVYHLLPSITQPVLLISGYFDPLTPPMQSVEIARKIPHSVHYCEPFSGHLVLLESPEWCMAEISNFLKDQDLIGEEVGSASPVTARRKSFGALRLEQPDSKKED